MKKARPVPSATTLGEVAGNGFRRGQRIALVIPVELDTIISRGERISIRLGPEGPLANLELVLSAKTIVFE